MGKMLVNKVRIRDKRSLIKHQVRDGAPRLRADPESRDPLALFHVLPLAID